MSRFSERNGYVQPRTAIQRESLDEETRTELWNLVYICMDHEMENIYPQGDDPFTRVLWGRHLNRALDVIPSANPQKVMAPLRQQVLSGEFYEVMDLVEFLAGWEKDGNGIVTRNVNSVFRRYLVAYRLVDGKVVGVTSQDEVEAIEAALDTLAPYSGARAHLSNALSLLADRQSPHYSNSLKESISAVESVAKSITGKHTLGEALIEMRKKHMNIHPALNDGWSKLYGYSSDADGIRHGSIDPSEVDEPLATYFLVSCSAFVSFLIKMHESTTNP